MRGIHKTLFVNAEVGRGEYLRKTDGEEEIVRKKNCLTAFAFLNFVFKMSINIITNTLSQIRKDIFEYFKIRLKVVFEQCFGAGGRNLNNPTLYLAHSVARGCVKTEQPSVINERPLKRKCSSVTQNAR